VVFLALLLLVPVAVRYWSKRRKPAISWTLTGVAFGAVISPVSLGLYATYFYGPFFIVTGMVGLLSTLFHGAPGYYLCLWSGLVKTGVVSGSASFGVETVNGLLWGSVYGGAGAVFDRLSALRPAL